LIDEREIETFETHGQKVVERERAASGDDVDNGGFVAAAPR
jgi:hypothetical protein